MSQKAELPPTNYSHCFASPEQCSRCGSCLRSYAAELKANDFRPLMCVHPLYIEKVAQGQPCEYYRKRQFVTIAYGFTHMYDTIPTKLASELKCEIQSRYLSRDIYYRARKGERPLTPQDQEFIAEQFKQLGIEGTPHYDRTEEHLDW